MNTIALPTFNPLQFANRLKAAGVPEKQAEAEAEVLREAFNERDHALAELEKQFNTQKLLSEKEAEQMATKGDIALIRKDMEVGFAEVRGKLTLLYWMFGGMIAALFAVAAALAPAALRTYFGG